jgi:hypothetical protein
MARARQLVTAHPLLAITFAAALARVGWLLVQSGGADDPLAIGGGDGYGYWLLAQHISHGFSLDDPLFLFRPPGYPAAIAGALLVVPGGSEWVAIAVTMAASIATVPLTYALAIGLGVGRRVALVAAAIIAIEPTSVQLAGMPLSDPLFALLLIGGTVLALQALRREQRALAYAGGSAVCLGLAALTKPIGLGFCVVIAVVLVFGARPFTNAKRMLAAGLVVLVSLGTYVGLREVNQHNLGVAEFNTAGAWNVYFQRGAGILRRVQHKSPDVVQQELADDLSVALGATPSKGRDAQSYQQTTDPRAIHLMSSRGWRIIRHNPVWFAALYPLGAAKLWFEAVDGHTPRAPHLLFLLLLYAAAAVGGVQLWRRRSRLVPLLALGVVAYFTILTATTITAATSRLFLPVLPFLAVVAAVALTSPAVRALPRSRNRSKVAA